MANLSLLKTGFSGTTLPSPWTSSAPSVTTVAGGKAFLTPGTSLYPMIYSDGGHTFDSFSVEVIPSNTLVANKLIEVRVRDSDFNTVFFTITTNSTATARTLAWAYHLDSTGRTTVMGSTAYDTYQHRFLKMQYANEILSWYVSADGLSWNYLDSTNFFFNGTVMRAELYAGGTHAAFDNINQPPDASASALSLFL